MSDFIALEAMSRIKGCKISSALQFPLKVISNCVPHSVLSATWSSGLWRLEVTFSICRVMYINPTYKMGRHFSHDHTQRLSIQLIDFSHTESNNLLLIEMIERENFTLLHFLIWTIYMERRLENKRLGNRIILTRIRFIHIMKERSKTKYVVLHFMV